MKALICGLGSIGKRHLNNLLTLGFKPEDIAIYRTRKGTASFGDDVLAEHGDSLLVFDDLGKALDWGPKIALITNPTSEHVPTALMAAKAGCHLFIEKPLSNTQEAAMALIEGVVDRGNKIVAHVAYNLRHHPLFEQIYQWMEEEKVGDVVGVRAEMSENVSDWHPWEDHKTGYACRTDLGGGVVLTQSHEIDMLYCLFGTPSAVVAEGGSFGSISPGVTNTCQSIWRFQDFSAQLHVDYFGRPARRSLEIIGTSGVIQWDYHGKKVRYTPYSGSPVTVEEPMGYDRNDSFLTEMKEFLCDAEQCYGGTNSLEQSLNVLKIALATERSIKSHEWERP